MENTINLRKTPNRVMDARKSFNSLKLLIFRLYKQENECQCYAYR